MSPARRAPSASAAMPETLTSVGPPSARAVCRVGMVSGSTPTTLAVPSVAAATPAMSPPATHGHDDGVDLPRQVVQDLQTERARSGCDRRLVIGVAVHGTGRLRVLDR